MPKQARLVLPSTIAALAASLSLTALLPMNGAARAAETCLAAPKGTAPAGSHWYYRLERGTQRKCWRLVQKDQKGQSAAARAVPQGDADEEAAGDDAAPPAATPPATKKPATAAGVPDLKTMQSFVTKDASETAEASPLPPWPAPPADAAQNADASSTVAPVAQTQNDAPAPAPVAEQPAPQSVAQAAPRPIAATAADNAAMAADAGGMSTLQLFLAAIAALGFLACAFFYAMSVRRRRTDVLNRAQHLNQMPLEVPPQRDAGAAREAPTFAPLPPMELIPRHDDVDEALQRFSQNWKRRAA